jgi:hypothetical protein
MFDFLMILLLMAAVVLFLWTLIMISFYLKEIARHTAQLAQSSNQISGDLHQLCIEGQVITSAISEVSRSIDQAATPMPLVILRKGNGSKSGYTN